ncbi:hypothetical protein [Angustibacter luteus]|uniref:Uncharacterized protein n=1 Tax=Angustibacter luteus TaxID=658456 RepID=A0ABW1JI49_9ACTN
MPTLSAGKHRSPRTGACVMEFASYLAGERWSDQPRCTHPLLAELARGVNDHVSDDARQRLVPLVPAVIGLTSDDPRVDAHVALLAAAAALPIAAEPTQRALAVAVLTCSRVLADLDGSEQRAAYVEAVLERAPQAEQWARRFTDGSRVPSLRVFRRYAAPHTVRYAVRGIAKAAVPDPDARLCALLEQAVAQFPSWTGSRPATELAEVSARQPSVR